MAFWTSVRFSLRILRKYWKLTSIAVFSLAIAIAAGAAGISVFNALLLRPPVAAEPQQLVSVYESAPRNEFSNVSYADYKYYRDNNHVFSGVLAFPFSISLTPISVEHQTKSGLVNAVSDNFFSVLGVRPILGRTFAKGDDDGKSPLAVLSYPYWKWLGADPNIVGKSVHVGRIELTIIGVMPKYFSGTIFSDFPDFWYPLSVDTSGNQPAQDWRSDRTNRSVGLIGRLKPGVSLQQAQADLQILSQQIAAAYPQTSKDRVAHAAPTKMIPPDAVGPGTVLALILLAIVALVLFAACSNVVNLLLALTSARRHEILVRAAMGATRSRLIREVLLDSTLIATAGGIIGVLLASFGLRELTQFKPYIPGFGVLPLTIDFRPDATVIAASALVILAAGFATGLVPGLYASTPNLAAALSGEITVGGTRKGRIRGALVAIQVAVCTLVLIGVGLCFQSLQNLRHVNLGFSARKVAIVTADLQEAGYAEARGRSAYSEMRQAASQVPGVEAVSLAGNIPVSGNEGSADQVRIEGAPAGEQGGSVAHAVVDDSYFSTLGIPLLAGRVFMATDTAKAPEVVVINHFMAEKYWPGQSPVGNTVRIENGNRLVTVVGVAADGKYVDIDEAPRPFMYFDLNQHYQPVVYLLARTADDPQQRLTPITDAIVRAERGLRVEPGLFFSGLTLDQWMNFNLYIPRITVVCISAFGALAFLLAAVGLYGAVFYSVSERKKEFGIRAALGAAPQDIWIMILRQTSVVTASGVGLGMAGGVVASSLVRSLLYGIRPVEGFVFVAVAAVMAAMTILTAFSAARPWLHADPLESVRHA
jgi:predicted permease